MKMDLLKEANDLNKRIIELKDFLKLCKKGSKESSYGTKEQPKYNTFSKLIVSAFIWTGSDNPRYNESITNKDDIDLLVETFEQTIEIQIKKLEKRLNEIIPSNEEPEEMPQFKGTREALDNLKI